MRGCSVCRSACPLWGQTRFACSLCSPCMPCQPRCLWRGGAVMGGGHFGGTGSHGLGCHRNTNTRRFTMKKALYPTQQLLNQVSLWCVSICNGPSWCNGAAPKLVVGLGGGCLLRLTLFIGPRSGVRYIARPPRLPGPKRPGLTHSHECLRWAGAARFNSCTAAAQRA